MFRKHILVLFTILATSWMSGCASRTIVDPMTDLPERSSETAVLIDYMIDADRAMPKDFGCNLVFKQSNGEEWSIKLDFLQTRVFAYVSPGKMVLSELNCQDWGVFPARAEEQPLAGEVVEGRLNYFGFVSFKYISGSLSWEFIKDKTTREKLRRSTESLSQFWRDNLITVQSGRPIYNALRKFDEVPAREVKWVSHSKKGRTDFEVPKLERCDRFDRFNPIVIGQMNLIVDYNEGRYFNHQWIKRDHTHSKAFEECVVDMIRFYSPETKESVQLDIKL